MSSSEINSPPTREDEPVKKTVESVAGQIRASAADASTKVKDTAADVIQEQKKHTANRIRNYGDALHQTAESTRDQDPNIAWLTEQASARLQKAADYMRDSSWPRLREDGAALARRHPVVFFGGMFVLGAMAGAVVRAGVEAVADDTEDDIAAPPSEAEKPESVPAGNVPSGPTTP